MLEMICGRFLYTGDLNEIIPQMKKNLLKQVQRDLDIEIEDGEFLWLFLNVCLISSLTFLSWCFSYVRSTELAYLLYDLIIQIN